RSAIEQREHKSPLTKPNYKKSPHGENQRAFWRSKLKTHINTTARTVCLNGRRNRTPNPETRQDQKKKAMPCVSCIRETISE
ncbi:hypothetical protein, partial [Roseibium sp. SCP14]|uniref:hypothetical protein n=1 Tax=Roseibium sp. SCP14 TaxID=3141375 RepID=UPI003337B541